MIEFIKEADDCVEIKADGCYVDMIYKCSGKWSFGMTELDSAEVRLIADKIDELNGEKK